MIELETLCMCAYRLKETSKYLITLAYQYPVWIIVITIINYNYANSNY